MDCHSHFFEMSVWFYMFNCINPYGNLGPICCSRSRDTGTSYCSSTPHGYATWQLWRRVYPFFLCLPNCLAVFICILGTTGEMLASLPFTFWAWINIAALTQVIFTILLVQLFSHRSFAAAVAFSKTEVLQTAIFEALILGCSYSSNRHCHRRWSVCNCNVGICKNQFINCQHQQSLLSRQMAIGLAAGAFLGFCTVAYGLQCKP